MIKKAQYYHDKTANYTFDIIYFKDKYKNNENVQFGIIHDLSLLKQDHDILKYYVDEYDLNTEQWNTHYEIYTTLKKIVCSFMEGNVDVIFLNIIYKLKDIFKYDPEIQYYQMFGIDNHLYLRIVIENKLYLIHGFNVER